MSEESEIYAALVDDFLNRKRLGEDPSVEEYCARHPELADKIRHLVAVQVMMENVKPRSDQANEPPLDRFGGYRITSEIARGGMGVVYEAEQESLGRRVALKVLPQSISRDERLRTRFRLEARAAARMHHTNIVPVFEVGEDGGYLYYAMQLIQGQGLDAVINDVARMRDGSLRGDSLESEPVVSSDRTDHLMLESIAASLLTGQFAMGSLMEEGVHDGQTVGKTPGSNSSASSLSGNQIGILSGASGRPNYYRSVARVGLQVAEALAYAHERGIIHRDIKPSNLLLDGDGVVWVTDFGVAKAGEDELTRTGDVVGTVRYMSPERFQGKCDARADVYSLGLTLHEMLTLRPAFESSDRLQLIERVVNFDPPKPRSMDPRIPRDLETIVLKAIDKDPKSRYQSAQLMAEDLGHFLDDQPIRARRISVPERMVRWSQRNKRLAASIAAVFLMVAGLICGWFWTLSSAARTSAQLAEHASGLAADAVLGAADRAFEDRLYQRAAVLAAKSLEIKESPPGTLRLQSALAAMPAFPVWTAPSFSDRVTTIAYSPDGKTLAAACEDMGIIWLWDAMTLREVQRLQGHEGGVLAIAFSPSGRYLLSGAADHTARLWQVSSGAEVWRRNTSSALPAVSVSPNGRLAAAGGTFQGDVWVWDVASGREVKRYHGHTAEVRSLAFSPDTKQLATASLDETIRVWDLTSDSHRQLSVGSSVNAVCYYANNQLFAVCVDRQRG